MSGGKAYTIDYKRKRLGRTDYRSRIKLISSGMPRVVVRRSLNNSYVQIAEFHAEGDKTFASSSTIELIKYGWKGHRGNIPAAYLAGFLCGLKARKKNMKSGILDIGTYRAVSGSLFFAAAAGLKDAGFEIAVGDSVPDESRRLGKHIENYANLIKGDFQQRFSKYLKAGIDPANISRHTEEVKKKISEKWH